MCFYGNSPRTRKRLSERIPESLSDFVLLVAGDAPSLAVSKLPFQQDTDRQAPDRAWHVGGSLSIWKKPKTEKPAPRRATVISLERSCARIVATHIGQGVRWFKVQEVQRVGGFRVKSISSCRSPGEKNVRERGTDKNTKNRTRGKKDQTSQMSSVSNPRRRWASAAAERVDRLVTTGEGPGVGEQGLARRLTSGKR